MSRTIAESETWYCFASLRFDRVLANMVAWLLTMSDCAHSFILPP